MTHDSTTETEPQVLNDEKVGAQSSQNIQIATLEFDGNDALINSIVVDKDDPKPKLKHNCFLLMSNRKLSVSKESARKGGGRADLLPEGWVFELRENAEALAIEWTKGKRIVTVIPWYNSLIKDLWNGSKSESKLARRKISLEINQNKNNQKLRKIEKECRLSGLDPTWLYSESPCEDLTDKEKKLFEHYKPLWESAREVKGDLELEQHDIKLTEEDLQEAQAESVKRNAGYPWSGVDIPDGYDLRDSGLWKECTPKKSSNSDKDSKEEEPKEIKISDPVWIAARSRDFSGSNSGLIIKWVDLDGVIRETCIERRKLHTNGNPIAEELAHHNLSIIPGKEKKLSEYLSAFKTNRTYRSVKSLGWLENPVGDLIYVSKKRTFKNHNKGLEEQIIFQSETISGVPSPLECGGSLEEWKENIAIPCRGNIVPIFLQSFALSGTIVKYADTGSRGIHLSGITSRGKTTAAQIAASTTGCAPDPAYAPKLSIIRRWLATANALESLASQYTDSVLVLDEIGQCPGSDLDKVIYNLFGGRGKERLTQQSQHKATRDWCTIVISTGEKTLQERLAETNSNTPGGLFVRFVDLHVEEVFTDYHGENSKTFVDKLKSNCGQFYGTAASAFIQKIVDTYKSAQDLREAIANGCDSLERNISGGILLSQEHSRVLKLFCFAALTGIWASTWEIFPYTSEEILTSSHSLFAKWHESNQKQTTEVCCICAIRDYYLKKRESAFRPCDLPDKDLRRFSDIFGYTTGQGKFYLTKEGLDQALGSLSKKTALKALLANGYLLREESPARNDSKKTIGGIKGAPRVYVIAEKICEFDGEIV